MALRTSDLSPGERLLIRRRRERLSQATAAAAYGVSLFQYRKWEADEPGMKPPRAACGGLQLHEACFLRRHRAGLGLQELADELGCCRFWLRRMEIGEAPVDTLAKYWGE